MLTAALRPWAVTILFVAAILVGSLTGALAPATGSVIASVVDPSIMVLVGLLVFTLRLESLAALKRAPRTVLLALTFNFALVPVIAFCLTSLLLPDQALRLGVLIYCLFPCTDWFLGFTRMAGGDTTTGASLIPIQMSLQLVLYPVWLGLFGGQQVGNSPIEIAPTLVTWFAVPAGIALAARLFLWLCLDPTARERVVQAADSLVPLVIAVVIVGLFAGNVGTILADPAAFAWVLLVVFLFFVVVFVIVEGVARLFHLGYPSKALLTMTTSARNAPLMLAVTTIALPDQPVVYAAIILGMLIEFPHLTALTHLLRRQEKKQLDGATRASVTA